MIIDHPRQFDHIDVDLLMSKMPSLIGPDLQCLKSPTYSISDSWAHTTFLRFRWNIGPSLLSLGGFSDTWDMQDLLQSNWHLDLT